MADQTNIEKSITIDGRVVPYGDERNLLELVRKAGIDLPTFCYHSELSIYGACRLCIVEVEGRGIQGACSTPLEPGLKVRTSTEEIREIRRITVELLLANHDQRCPTCPKSDTCQLQALARRFGIQKVRFKPVLEWKGLDESSVSLTRDPNKCVLCGDCTRVCSEIQGIGAIDFAYRGHQAAVIPTYGRDLAAGECVNCGQCAAVCPTGSLAPKSEVPQVWKALADKSKRVIAQIAPAVRVALSEEFGLPTSASTAGQAVAALKAIGFHQVYDTAYSADLTVVEEANEFLVRKQRGEKLPQFTSCCPAWVKYAEQYFPDLLPHLSSCRSPQQMLGSLVKEMAPEVAGAEAKDVIVVSIMPCTAKKFEARRPEFTKEGRPDVDYVLTTVELAHMIKEAGLRLQELVPESFDLPMGFKTGAGILFGNSGGVTEAVLRFAAEKVTGEKLKSVDFVQVRGEDGLREVSLDVKGTPLKLAIVHGLGNAKKLAEKVRKGEADYDLIEVMACPGGCIGGAGQPISTEAMNARRARTKGLYQADKELNLHKAQENPFVTELYASTLGEVGGHKAHHLLHTHYQSRRRTPGQEIRLGAAAGAQQDARVRVEVCMGTSCFVRGSQSVLQSLLREVDEKNVEDLIDVRASFCFERCESGPSASVAGQAITAASSAKLRQVLLETMAARGMETSHLL